MQERGRERERTRGREREGADQDVCAGLSDSLRVDGMLLRDQRLQARTVSPPTSHIAQQLEEEDDEEEREESMRRPFITIVNHFLKYLAHLLGCLPRSILSVLELPLLRAVQCALEADLVFSHSEDLCCVAMFGASDTMRHAITSCERPRGREREMREANREKLRKRGVRKRHDTLLASIDCLAASVATAVCSARRSFNSSPRFFSSASFSVWRCSR